MERNAQTVMNEVIGTKVIIEYVNRQNACCDERYMSSAAGKLEMVTDEGVQVDIDFVPFAGPLAAICTIRQVGNNKPVYENTSARDTYQKQIPITEEQMKMVRSQGRWVY